MNEVVGRGGLSAAGQPENWVTVGGSGPGIIVGEQFRLDRILRRCRRQLEAGLVEVVTPEPSPRRGTGSACHVGVDIRVGRPGLLRLDFTPR